MFEYAIVSWKTHGLVEYGVTSFMGIDYKIPYHFGEGTSINPLESGDILFQGDEYEMYVRPASPDCVTGQ